PHTIAQLLHNRKITDINDVEKFLNPSWSDNHDPFLLKNMEKSIARFYAAIQNNEHITIYADYDADGVPGSIVLSDLLKKIKYTHYDIYIPHRHHEGYGIHTAALEKIKKSGTTLIVSIDVGITEHAAAQWCAKNNIDLIITDHHTPLKKSDGSQDLPEPFALINPKQETCNYPDAMLCGCGVIFKFVQAFIQRHGDEYNIHAGWEKWLLDMVGISTISDMVPLQNENRIFAYFGLKVMQEVARAQNKRIGLKKMMWDAGINSRHMTETDIAFGITPKINAASRMSHPMDAVAVFNATNDIDATTSMKHLVALNNERKKLTKKMTAEAIAMLSEREIGNVIIVGQDDWQAGILGLVASKLVEKYRVPVFTWSREGDVILGSARSLDGLHLVEIMQLAPKKSFIGFGGHAEAGGYRCNPDEIEKLQKRLETAVKKFTQENTNRKKDTIHIDMELSADDVNTQTYTDMRKLAPFGIGNPEPLFIIKNVFIDSANEFGKEKNHLELSFKNSLGISIRAIKFFSTVSDFEKLIPGQTCDIIGHLEYSVFMGRHELRMKLVDVL
ncbi:MAG: single-stranded-DNA-specific exonuclease RecJ, partial [Minisyncoccia bacterium]